MKTGWTLEYVRNLMVQDFFKVLKVCIVYESLNKKFEAEMATAGLSKKNML